MPGTNTTLRADNPRRCTATEWRMVRFRHSVVRTLVQCGLPKAHEGDHTSQRIPFGVRSVP